MRLSEFIQKNQSAIIKEWENFASSHVAGAEQLDRASLQDHIIKVLKFISEDLETSQTAQEQSQKSKGDGEENINSGAKSHAEQRFSVGFDSLEMISEFRALRASIIKKWGAHRDNTEQDFLDLIRFDESIDQILAESLMSFTDKTKHARSLFSGTLVHDLQGPLNSIRACLRLLSEAGNFNDEQIKLASAIDDTFLRISALVSDLIDEARSRLGQGMPISPGPMDMGVVAQQSVREVEAAYSGCKISLETAGDLKGQWDSARVGQVISNLLNNAIKHGSRTPIHIIVRGKPEEVILSVRNYGTPIPPDFLPTIFDPLTRGIGKAQMQSKPTSLGLGLFIVREVVVAHSGGIDVTSTAEEGTTFTAHFPRVSPASTYTLAARHPLAHDAGDDGDKQ
jgi:signal transduction histidine kinase